MKNEQDEKEENDGSMGGVPWERMNTKEGAAADDVLFPLSSEK